MFELRVYYEDTDTGGVVYYANYLKYFERARTELFRAWGVDIRALMEEGCYFVVNTVAMKLHAPARYGDVLQVETRLTSLAAVTLDLEYVVRRGETRLVTGSTRMACVNREMKPVKFPPAAKAAFAAHRSESSAPPATA